MSQLKIASIQLNWLSATIHTMRSVLHISIAITLLATVLSIQPTQAQTITTVAGNGTAGFAGDGSAATAANINGALGLAVDNAGNLYLADWNNYRIRKVNTSGTINTIAGTGSSTYGGDGGSAYGASFPAPTGLAIDSTGNLYIADNSANRIRMINTSGIITLFAGSTSYGFAGDGGAATAASLYGSTSVTVDRAGNVYIADVANQRIRKVNTSGIISTFAGTGTAGFSGDGGPATAAALNGPTSIAFDRAGNAYIADRGNNRIRKVDASGNISTFAGSGAASYYGDGGAATSAGINTPWGVAVDTTGAVYLSEEGSNCIRRINTCGLISTFAGDTSRGYAGDGGPATAAKFDDPQAIALDAAGNLYISDRVNNRIRKVTPFVYPSAGTLSGATSVCPGSSISLTRSVAGGTWQTSRTGISTIDASGNLRGITPGNDTVRYIVSDGCYRDTARYAIRVNAYTDADTIFGPRNVCQGGIIRIIAGVPGGRWVSANSSIAAVDSTGIVTGVSRGTGVIIYYVTGPCGVDSTSMSLTVAPLPDSGIISGPDSICIGDTVLFRESVSGGIWTSMSGAAVVQSGGRFYGYTLGRDTIVYTVRDTCGSTSARKEILVKRCRTGLATLTASNVRVYPNPAHGVLMLEGIEAFDDVQLRDITGRTVIQQRHSGHTATLSLQGLAQGLYQLVLFGDGRFYTQKIVVE